MTQNTDTVVGTFSGTLLVIMAIPFESLATTAVLGFLGAIFGYLGTLTCKKIAIYFSRKK